MNLDTTGYTNAMKEFYTELFDRQYAKQTVFLDEAVFPRMEGPRNVSGTNAVVALEGLAMGGVGSRGQDEDLPTPEPGIYQRVLVPMKYHYAAFRFTGPVREASRNTQGAFDPAVPREMSGKITAFLMNINRQVIQSDSYGCIARVDATPALSGTTFAVDRAGNQGATGNVGPDTNGHLFISKNMNIEVWSGNSTGTKLASCRVTAVTKGSGTSTSARITVDSLGAWTPAGSEYIFLEGARGNEMYGLDSFCSASSTLFGLSPTDFVEWAAQIRTGATAGTAEAISTHRIAQILTDLEVNIGAKASFLLAHPNVVLTYADYARRTRIQVNTMKLSEGWTGVDFNGDIPFIKEPYCPNNCIYPIVPSVMGIYQMNKPGWIEEGGGIIKQVGRRDVWEAQYKWYAQFCTWKRAACAKLSDITELS